MRYKSITQSYLKYLDNVKANAFTQGTIIQTRITCKKILGYIPDSTCRTRIAKNAKILWSYFKQFLNFPASKNLKNHAWSTLVSFNKMPNHKKQGSKGSKKEQGNKTKTSFLFLIFRNFFLKNAYKALFFWYYELYNTFVLQEN